MPVSPEARLCGHGAGTVLLSGSSVSWLSASKQPTPAETHTWVPSWLAGRAKGLGQAGHPGEAGDRALARPEWLGKEFPW